MAEQFGRVNMVVNNAGVTVTGDFEEMSYEDFDWIVGVNFTGVINGTKEFLPHLIASGDGHLINISSLFGLISMPGQTAYNATKYAVRGFTEALREEMLINGHNVGVTCVHPGGIKTGIARNGRKTPSQDAAAIDSLFDDKLARTTAEKAARVILKGALGRQGTGARGRGCPRHAPLREARRLALPGRRGQGGTEEDAGQEADQPTDRRRQQARALGRMAAWRFERETARLRLRRPVAEDLPGFVALHSDPRTYEHAPESMPTEQQCRERLASYILDWAEFGFGYLAVEEIQSGRLVGWGGVRLTASPRTLNLYYRLAHDALGQGYGRELVLAIVAAAREELPDHTLVASIKRHNRRIDGHRTRCRPRGGGREGRPGRRTRRPALGHPRAASCGVADLRDQPGPRCRRRRRRRPARRLLAGRPRPATPPARRHRLVPRPRARGATTTDGPR